MSMARWVIGVVAAVAVLALALWFHRAPSTLAATPGVRLDNKARWRTAPASSTWHNSTWPTWLFQFAIYFTANVTVNSTSATMATGAEYFSIYQQMTRRDWAQTFPFPACPLAQNAAGTEYYDWSVRTRHVMQNTAGDWTCVQDVMLIESQPPTPDFLLHATKTDDRKVVRGELCYGYNGRGTNRPGPHKQLNDLWTIWVSNSSGVPMQIECETYTVDVWNWAVAPVGDGGSRNDFSVPLECPIDVPPGWFGYTLSAAFLAILFAGVLSIRRKADGSAF